MILLKIIILFLLADLVTGLFHFYADRYGKLNGKYMSKSINGLLLHHTEPYKMLTQSYWELCGGVYKAGAVLFVLSLWTGLHWEVPVFIFFSAQANMVHKWSHQSKSSTQSIVRFLQWTGVILGRSQHQKHHAENFMGHYCVLSTFWNWLFDALKVWNALESLLRKIGIKPAERFEQDLLIEHTV